ncbi:MAG: CotH kinase family protein [Bacteroidales bacterium]|nr:CotH kinase family protein [Candidatus Physcousia equi]
MKKLNLICLLFLLCTTAMAQISSLSELSNSKKYLIRNANGYGYCIYVKDRANYVGSNYFAGSNYLTLGEATTTHPSGVHENNASIKDAIDKKDNNNLWYITKNSDGTYYLKNVAMNMYATNEYQFSYGWQQTYTYADAAWQLSQKETSIRITQIKSGIFGFQVANGSVEKEDELLKRFMCAASQNGNAIANWTSDDLGSQWEIIDPSKPAVKVSSITLNHTTLELTAGATATLTATVLPENASSPRVEWTSSKPHIVSVTDGELKAFKSGTATITCLATDGSGVSATCEVTVNVEREDLGTLHYFTMSDGELIVIPEKYMLGRSEADGKVTINLVGDTAYVFNKKRLVSEDTEYHGDLPAFESFKFNNKFNDQLHTDADGVVDSCTVDVAVACIGKRLTPSFKLPEGAHAFISNVEQHSKVTRRRFDTDVIYTVAYPNNWIYRVEKVKDEVWSTPEDNQTESEWLVKPFELKADQLSTNAPSNYNEGLDNLLDGEVSTYFHSTWGSGEYQKLDWKEGSYYGDGSSQWPYIQIDLPESISALQFSYTTRSGSDRTPLGFILQGSNNGKKWEDLQSFEQGKDQLPAEAGGSFTSPIVTLSGAYSHLRMQLTSSTYKNYLVLSEFSLSKVEKNPNYNPDYKPEKELISPAVYEHKFVPFGRDYTVRVDYLTDHPSGEHAAYNVPRIDIYFGDGKTWDYDQWIGLNGKTFWEDATIKIDGVGVFPDMEETAITIKGRGNTSWSNSYSSKNPYRIKFPEKVKPFGLTKGKNWVLLANKQTGSMTSNAIAMKIADMVETAACNHIVPVELYINNQYRGSYNFTEKVGFANNSVSLTDESAAVMLELDTYTDEEIFNDETYGEPVKIKAPDFTDETAVFNIDLYDVQSSFENLAYSLKNTGKAGSKENFTTLIDVPALCRAMLVTDLTMNQELKHPKSWYLYNPDILNDSLWVFGPVWDFDWAYGYESNHTYFIKNAESDLFRNMTEENLGYPFFYDLLRSHDTVKKEYYRLWTRFMEKDMLGELTEFCDDYYAYTAPSFKHNAEKHGDGNGYQTTTNNSKNWLTKRANYIYRNLDVYDLSADIDDTPEDFDPGQPIGPTDDPTRIVDLAAIARRPVDVYTLQGVRVRTRVPYINYKEGLQPGVYVVDGKKVLVR